MKFYCLTTDATPHEIDHCAIKALQQWDSYSVWGDPHNDDRRLVISDSSIDLFHIGIELLKAGHLDTRVIVLY